MKRIFLTLAAAVVSMTALPVAAQQDYRHETAANIRSELKLAKTPGDSIKIMYNIYDLLPKSEKPAVAREIYAIAERNNDYTTRLDICRVISSCFNDDRVLSQIEREVQRIPSSPEQKETALFLKMKRLSVAARHKPEAERMNEIIRIITELDDKEKFITTPIDKLYDLFTVVQYLRNDASGDMLKEYLDKMILLSTSSQFKLYAIPTIVYAEAARIYADAGDYAKAVDGDRKLLNVLAGLKEKYRKRGRKYREYDLLEFEAYRRMLQNYPALKSGEIDDIYDKALKLVENNSDVKHVLETDKRFYAYYYYAKGEYAQAIPYLRESAKEVTSLPTRKQLLERLIDAAERTGDSRTNIEALNEYSDLLEELNRLKADERYKELQIKYEVQDLKSKNSALELENRNDEISATKRMMTFVGVAFLLIFAVLITSLYHWGKTKRNASRMGEVVDNMNHEREELRRSLYYDYADENDSAVPESHETESWRERMKKMGSKWENVSIFLTNSILNDLMYIAATGHADRLVHIDKISIKELMKRLAAMADKGDLAKARIEVEYPEEDMEIVTDTECLMKLFGDIFEAGAKYSPTDTVTMSCKKGPKGYVDFVITTVGAQSAGPDDPEIFDDFESAHKLLARKGSGLFICRMISLLLRCKMIPERGYKNGARYLIRVPETLLNEP